PVHTFLAIVLTYVFLSTSCQDDPDPAPEPFPPVPGPSALDSLYRPVDPSTAASIGFFLDDWKAKVFVAPSSHDPGAAASGSATDTINIDLNKVVTKVPKYIFGNNANQWMGQIADQPALVNYLKDLNAGVMRFPGGSISDVYFWN